MQTPNGSAQAYDKLASLTNAANHAARLSHDWLKLSRAIRDLISDLAFNEPADSWTIQMLTDWKAAVILERNNASQAAEKLSSECVALNERIQNGVYNG